MKKGVWKFHAILADQSADIKTGDRLTSSFYVGDIFNITHREGKGVTKDLS